MMMATEQSKMPVTFTDVRFLRATFLAKNKETQLTIVIQRGEIFLMMSKDFAIVVKILLGF